MADRGDPLMKASGIFKWGLFWGLFFPSPPSFPIVAGLNARASALLRLVLFSFVEFYEATHLLGGSELIESL